MDKHIIHSYMPRVVKDLYKLHGFVGSRVRQQACERFEHLENQVKETSCHINMGVLQDSFVGIIEDSRAPHTRETRNNKILSIFWSMKAMMGMDIDEGLGKYCNQYAGETSRASIH